jgi:hypothetical protein
MTSGAQNADPSDPVKLLRPRHHRSRRRIGRPFPDKAFLEGLGSTRMDGRPQSSDRLSFGQ